ncbi:DinB family protein [Dactylosporangium fulvum]|uniref:DinB family protein n=1 Tax=Dactylosporangium fulvum TaxID=53359 RepID=A0ABY5VNE3_9ACTN|nr:DinB family protein [Dactylosporangium fulvum]UWP78609.1 DinB family protein [Dactylosporangium fulvum]
MADRTWKSFVRNLADRIELDLRGVLDGLDPELLDAVAEPGTNSIGWLLWHLTRGHDRNISELSGQAQLWVTDGWHVRFGRPADPDETGYRHTPEQVAAFHSPEPAVIGAYHWAVVTRLRAYLDAAPAGDPARLATSPTLGDTVPVQQRLVGVLVEGLEHVGQAAFLRGVLERRGQ